MTRSSLAASLLCWMAAACGPQATPWPEAAWDTVGADDPVPSTGARRNLVLTSTEVVHSAPTTLTLAGLAPGEQAHFVRGTGAGDGPCPPRAGGVCVDLDGAAVLGSSIADASGAASITVTVPATAAGGALALQGLVVRGVDGEDSATSNLVLATVRDVPSSELDEDFETGDFAAFPHTLGGLAPWVIEAGAAACHGGAFCARNSLLQAPDESTTIDLPVFVRTDDSVTFWAATDTEPGEHFLRFSIDGVQVLQISGATPWQSYTFPVAASDPDGPDRVLTWQYDRSAFVDPTRPPLNSVWIDDIDLPAWNSPPTVPEPLGPGPFAVTDSAPVLAWSSEDADVDPITYELQLDTDPAFGAPISTGETSATAGAGPTSEGVWFWRVRARDALDTRWSDWSAPRSIELDPLADHPVAWQQRVAAQFAEDTHQGTVISGDTLIGSGSEEVTFDTGESPIVTTSVALTLDDLPDSADQDAHLEVCVRGDFDGGLYQFDYITSITVDGDVVESGWYPWTGYFDQSCRLIPIDASAYVGDGTVDIAMYKSFDVFSFAGQAFLTYDTLDSGVVVSTPISFSDFPDAAVWDHVHWQGQGVTLRVLDADQVPLPDEVLPGNAAGFTATTVHLFDVDPAEHPVLHLEATVAHDGWLDAWSAVAGEGFTFTFGGDGDAEGWVAVLDGATPTLTVEGGVLALDAPAAGADPRVELTFPQPVDARAFSTLEVRLRTSNTSLFDEPTLYWATDVAPFDPVRSLVHPAIYLLEHQDAVFDLTTVVSPPQERWDGMIEAIRLDPVADFVDVYGAPVDGWFEIDRIELR